MTALIPGLIECNENLREPKKEKDFTRITRWKEIKVQVGKLLTGLWTAILARIAVLCINFKIDFDIFGGIY